jgi:hypothetical protein
VRIWFISFFSLKAVLVFCFFRPRFLFFKDQEFSRANLLSARAARERGQCQVMYAISGRGTSAPNLPNGFRPADPRARTGARRSKILFVFRKVLMFGPGWKV